MNKNERFVITVNRELGSGGRTVSEKLAAKLGVPFYDKALIEGLREKYHLAHKFCYGIINRFQKSHIVQGTRGGAPLRGPKPALKHDGGKNQEELLCQ